MLHYYDIAEGKDVKARERDCGENEAMMKTDRGLICDSFIIPSRKQDVMLWAAFGRENGNFQVWPSSLTLPSTTL
jgi:hypothetical protein